MNPTKLPPNQQLAAPGKWPLVGEREPDVKCVGKPWSLTVEGLVAQPCSWTLEELRAMPQLERVIDIHCVTRWSKPGARFAGVALGALLEACRPLPQARFLSFVARSSRGHSTSLPLQDALQLDVLVALEYEGQPLSSEHGGPLRTVVPQRYFYKSLKWLERIQVLSEDRLGYWEREAGYHNAADPWREQRYIVPDIDNVQHRRLLQKRDFSGQDLLGVQAQGRDLSGLNARRARLRDAHFEEAILQKACFDEANLSNAHLNGADLDGASFKGADCEGADFRGARLHGADFSGASLFGATFTPETPDDADQRSAGLDGSTRIEPHALEQLTPVQQAFVRRALGL